MDEETGDPPGEVPLEHSVEEVTRILSVLEAVEFKWTIQQVLEQDEAWLDDILTMKAIGSIIHRKKLDGNEEKS